MNNTATSAAATATNPNPPTPVCDMFPSGVAVEATPPDVTVPLDADAADEVPVGLALVGVAEALPGVTGAAVGNGASVAVGGAGVTTTGVLVGGGAGVSVGAGVSDGRGTSVGCAAAVAAEMVAKTRRVESGARVYGAEVKLSTAAETVFVPYANLELLR